MGTLELVKASESLCQDLDQGVFVPLLEADIAAYLYYRLIMAKISMRDIHLDTRVMGISQFKYDLVVGPVELDPKAQRAAVSDPKLVVQIKLFPRYGFTHQQHHVHYRHVIEDDIPSFDLLQMDFPACPRYELLADFHSRDLQGYLKGQDKSVQSSRIERICEAAVKSRISVGWLHPESQCKTAVEWWLTE